MPFQTTPAAYDLLHNAALGLAAVEHAGIRIDRGYLESALADTAARIAAAEETMRADPVYRVWQRRFGEQSNLGSADQLSKVVFGPLGYRARFQTKSGDRGSASEKALEGVDLPFVRQYLDTQRLRKARGTYLQGILREAVRHPNGQWYVHPSYHLNRVITFRSSCSDPSFQNQPNRIEWLAEMIRRCYIPRPGCQLLEVDESQIEVRIGEAYHHDPTMAAYIRDPDSDMHRDTAARIFFLESGEVSKPLRSAVKGIFVFAQFYGDYYVRCARGLWEECVRQKIKTGKNNDGIPIIEHLAANGIREMGVCEENNRDEPRVGSFEAHVRDEERHFWGTRFPVYAQWKKDYFAEYQRNGGFQMLTGFAVNLPLDRKQVCNSGIQGSSAHCAFWALPRIQAAFRRYKMRARVVGYIHDSFLFDAPPAERDAVIGIARQYMVDDLQKEWPWITSPLDVEAELCPLGQSWFDKAPLRESDGTYVPANLKQWRERYGNWADQN